LSGDVLRATFSGSYAAVSLIGQAIIGILNPR
jgi:hypothetical protein